MGERSRVLLVDDHRIVREGLRAVLKSQMGLEVVGEATDGSEAVRLDAELAPDVILMDVAMRGMTGIEATRRIVAERSNPRILALSMHADRRIVNEMLGAGASGYLLKDCAAEELAAAIKTVLAGKVYLSPAIKSTLAAKRPGSPGHAGLDKADPMLTRREREVLQHVADGKTSARIAEDLGVSIKTVETHRKQIMDKLGIRTIAGLTKYALRHGITGLN
jgi:two-component system response regulator NreC